MKFDWEMLNYGHFTLTSKLPVSGLVPGRVAECTMPGGMFKIKTNGISMIDLAILPSHTQTTNEREFSRLVNFFI